MKAEAAANPGKSLKDLSSGKKKDFTVLSPPPFSFLTNVWSGAPVERGFRPGQGSAIDFMQKVFSLAPNQVDVATNLPKTEIYVVRAVEFTPFKELWSDFTADADDWSVYTTLHAQRRRPRRPPACVSDSRGPEQSFAGLAEEGSWPTRD